MLQSRDGKECRVMKKHDLEKQVLKCADYVKMKQFAEEFDAIIGEVSDEPLSLGHVRRLIPVGRIVDAIIYFRETDNSLVFSLPWEFTLAAMLKVITNVNAADRYDMHIAQNCNLDERPLAVIDRHERTAILTKETRAVANQTHRDIRVLEAEMSSWHRERDNDRFAENCGSNRVVFLEDIPEFQEELPRRMSKYADPMLDFRPVLLWWSLLKHRDDADFILQYEIFPRSIARKCRLTMRDVLLVAIWQEASFPEDVSDVPDSLFKEHEIEWEGNLDLLQRRLSIIISSASGLLLEHVEAVRDEVLEDLGVQLGFTQPPAFLVGGFFVG
ncbi:hypothetical protein IT408_00970 [Candidatus Uhrbacteria bacterium]|nr:hypothetical protein [Candidatus Uhrbacteria bacterium]